MSALDAILTEITGLRDEKAGLDARREQIREEKREIEKRKRDLDHEVHASDERATAINKQVAALERAAAVLGEHQGLAALDEGARADEERPPELDRREPVERPRSELDESIEARHELDVPDKPKPDLSLQRPASRPPTTKPYTSRRESRSGESRLSVPRTPVTEDSVARTWVAGEKTSADVVDIVRMLLDDYDEISQAEIVQQVIEVTGMPEGTAGGYVSGALLQLRQFSIAEWTGRKTEGGSRIWKAAAQEAKV